ncbi:MAG: ATP-binding protein [Clostridia bacterium]|nr:ATP-binding protein [Clostridia bacterium]
MKAHSEDQRLITRLFFKLLPIQILLAAIASVNGIVSSLFASNGVDAAALSAVGLYGPINMLLGAIGVMMTAGSQLLCGKHMARYEFDRTRGFFTANIVTSTVVGAVATVILLLAPALGLTGIFTSDPEVLQYLNPYVLGMAAGVIPLLLSQQLACFLSLENKTRRTTIASIVYIAVNVLLNYLFVSVLDMKALGLALASSIGLWVFFGIQAQYFVSGKSTMKFSPKDKHRGDTAAILKIGYPGALSTGYQALRGIILNALILVYMGSLGSMGLSAFSAVNTFLAVFWSVHGGSLAVTRMLIGTSIGEEDRTSLANVMRVAMQRMIPILCLLAAVLSLLAHPLAGLYYQNPDEDVFRMAEWGFRILPWCMPIALISTHFVAYGQASGKNAMVHVLSALDGVICVAGLSAIIMPLIMPKESIAVINGPYLANILNNIICALVVLLFAVIAHKRMPRNMEELMVIPADFGVEKDARIDISVRSMDEVLTVSKQVIAFCRSRGIDEARAYRAGLFLEEMAGNVVDHGFHKDKKHHSVDIRVAHKDDDVILRIKDDCVPFDPAERAALMSPQDQVRNMGIRLVYKAAKKIDYQNMLGLNVLTIRI